MTVDNDSLTAEVLFDQISESYEDAYGGNVRLEKSLGRLKDYHGSGASILDVGCGPGGPASYLANSKFCVTGFDVSQSMINSCQKNIAGTFYKADMATFEPTQQFDAVVSLLSMFQMSYTASYSMTFKMTSWLHPGGTLILGTVLAEDIVKYLARVKGSDEYVERYGVEFMGRVVPSTLITMKGWLSMAQEAGLVIHFVERHSFNRNGIEGKEEQTFITAQKTHQEPLFGPYPLPNSRRRPHLLTQKAWQPFAERLTRHEFKAALRAVEDNKEVLDIGSGHGGE
ncbi:hypothetical protein IFR05_002393 [Cadophora sp. M221]|nr:hypothetical protein IFR05_002393 [Cadophora sp. M221]